MSAEEVTALTDFINAFDPRYESKALHGVLAAVLCSGRQGRIYFYSIGGYVENARLLKDVPELTAALDQWLTQREEAQ